MEITDSHLQQIIPFTFARGRDESTLAQRIQSYITEGTRFLLSDIIPAEAFAAAEQEQEDHYVGGLISQFRIIIAAHALWSAVPALDITLTATGFAVGSGDTLAPASSHRVSALRDSILLTRDIAIETAVSILINTDVSDPDQKKISDIAALWRISDQSRKFTSSVLSMRAVSTAVKGTLSYDTFIRHIDSVIGIQLQVALGYISVPTMYRLLKWQTFPSSLHGTPDTHNLIHFMRILPPIRTYILKSLQFSIGLITDIQILHSEEHFLLDTVEYIRTNHRAFPEWFFSPTSKLFERPPFRNTKKSGGYFM